MMKMVMKFFEGELDQIADKFNAWSDGSQYISHTAIHFKGKDHDKAVMQVIYGEKDPAIVKALAESKADKYKRKK